MFAQAHVSKCMCARVCVGALLYLLPAGCNAGTQVRHTADCWPGSEPAQRKCSCVPPAGCWCGNRSLWCFPGWTSDWSNCHTHVLHNPVNRHVDVDERYSRAQDKLMYSSLASIQSERRVEHQNKSEKALMEACASPCSHWSPSLWQPDSSRRGARGLSLSKFSGLQEPKEELQRGAGENTASSNRLLWHVTAYMKAEIWS